MDNVLDLSKLPAKVVMKNTSENTILILSRPGYSQGFALPSGQAVRLLAQTSSELISYLAQEQINPGLEVEIEESGVSE